MSETNQASAPAGEQENAGLTVTDLRNFKAIIEISAQRGAFRASEMEAVGNSFNKLTKFLDQVDPPKESAPAENTPAA